MTEPNSWKRRLIALSESNGVPSTACTRLHAVTLIHLHLPGHTTGNLSVVPGRNSGLRYDHNDIHIVIVEKLDAVVNKLQSALNRPFRKWSPITNRVLDMIDVNCKLVRYGFDPE